jgi:hypothetical protein
MNTEDLIKSLCKEGAKKPLDSPFAQLGIWLAISLIYVSTLGMLFGFRSDLSVKFSEPLFIFEILLLLFIGLSSGFTALCFSRPDCHQKPHIQYIPFTLLFMLALFFISFQPFCMRTLTSTSETGRFDCAYMIFALSLIPLASIFIVVKQGATTKILFTSFFASISAGTLAYLSMRVIEQNDDIFHLLLWHVTPVMLISFIGSIIGKKFFKW